MENNAEIHEPNEAPPIQKNLSLEKYGYFFGEHGVAKPDLFVGNNLFIAINPVPTKEHFDPKRVEAMVYDADKQDASRKRFGLQSKTKEQTLLPGVISVIDQNEINNKVINFYSFGGSIQMDDSEKGSRVMYKISSQAPIIQLTNTPPHSKEMSFWRELAMQTEAEYAKMRAARHTNKEPDLTPNRYPDPRENYREMVKILLTKQQILSGFKEWLKNHQDSTILVANPPR